MLVCTKQFLDTDDPCPPSANLETSKRLLPPPWLPLRLLLPQTLFLGLEGRPTVAPGSLAWPGSSLSSHPPHPRPRRCLFREGKDPRDNSSGCWVSGVHFLADVVSTLQLTMTQTNEMISPSPVFRLLIGWWHDPQGLEPSQRRVTVLPHRPDTITSPMLAGRQGRLSGWLQFTLLYLCLGINRSHPSTNPYLWLSKSQGEVKCFHLYSSCFPSRHVAPLLWTLRATAQHIFVFQSMPSLHCTYWHLRSIPHVHCELAVSRMFFWSRDVYIFGLNRWVLLLMSMPCASLPVFPAGGYISWGQDSVWLSFVFFTEAVPGTTGTYNKCWIGCLKQPH